MPEIDEPVHLSDWDPRWPALFRMEADRIAAALPPGVAIEHIGSTSVANMAAKPVIDIMAGIGPGASAGAIRESLAKLGYEDLGEAGVPGRLYFRRRAENAFNVHVVRKGGEIWNANLALREFLRSHPDAARVYAEAKRAAIAHGAVTLLAYSDYKRATIERLIAAAMGQDGAARHSPPAAEVG